MEESDGRDDHMLKITKKTPFIFNEQRLDKINGVARDFRDKLCMWCPTPHK